MNDEMNQLREYQAACRQLLTRQDEICNRLAGDLHDHVLQDLFVACHWVDLAQEAVFSEHAAEARAVLVKIVGYLRGLLFELRPPAWGRTGLRELLEDYALDFEERHGLGVIFEATGEGDDLPVPEEVKIALYRILQESLNNAWKHAQAQEVLITLDLQPDKVTLAIHDDGQGFEVPSHLEGPIKDGHLGLIGMRERATKVGGSFEVESEPGEWTRVLVQIPLSCS